MTDATKEAIQNVIQAHIRVGDLTAPANKFIRAWCPPGDLDIQAQFRKDTTELCKDLANNIVAHLADIVGELHTSGLLTKIVEDQ